MKNYLYIIIILFSNLITGQSKNNQNESLRVNEFYYHQTATSLSNELYDEIHEALI